MNARDPHSFDGRTSPPQGGVVLHAPGSPMEETLRVAAVFARKDAPVLLRGESGTGKEVLARFLHDNGPRASAPFVAVNCAAIAAGLAESELFGHCRGAFTHAVSDRPGHLRLAHGGTLLLDEVGDMPVELQARLLRALQERRVRPVGGDREFPVDFRLVCATHRDLAQEVRAGRFRADLYYRLRVLEMRLPPLRERSADIPVLLRAFLEEYADPARAEAALAAIPPEVLRHSFPGNVRELRNLAERHAALCEAGYGWDRVFSLADAAPLSAGEAGTAPIPFPVRSSRLRPADVLSALQVCGFHRGRAAEKLGVTRRALQYQLARMRSALPASEGGRLAGAVL